MFLSCPGLTNTCNFTPAFSLGQLQAHLDSDTLCLVWYRCFWRSLFHLWCIHIWGLSDWSLTKTVAEAATAHQREQSRFLPRRSRWVTPAVPDEGNGKKSISGIKWAVFSACNCLTTSRGCCLRHQGRCLWKIENGLHWFSKNSSSCDRRLNLLRTYTCHVHYILSWCLKGNFLLGSDIACKQYISGVLWLQ